MTDQLLAECEILKSPRLHLASLLGIIFSINYGSIPHDVDTCPLGTKCTRSNYFQADQDFRYC